MTTSPEQTNDLAGALPGEVVLNLADVAALLEKGSRVLLMTRHAERPKMDNDDPTFGMTLPITEAGQQMSFDFGTAFRAYAHETQFCASPLLRTRMTAAWIAKGMGIPDVDIPADDTLGNSTPYFASAYEVFELFRDGVFFPKMEVYLKTGRQRGFAEIHEATERLTRWCLERFTARLGIFTTHDVYIVAFCHAKGVFTRFNRETWTRFLDSAAIICNPDGTTRYALVRANLSDGICGV